MKQWSMVGLSLMLLGCSSPEPVAKDDSAQRVVRAPIVSDMERRKEFEPLAEYTGYWEQTAPIAGNLVRIETFEVIADGSRGVTKVSGLDLMNGFNYPTQAFGSYDQFAIEVIDGRAETVAEKVLFGKKRLLEIRYSLPENDRLDVVVRAGGKTEHQSYRRLTYGPEAKQRFYAMHLDRTRAFLKEKIQDQVDESCEGWQGKYKLESIVKYGMYACLNRLEESEPVDWVNSPGRWLNLAAESANAEMVRYLVGKGLDPNRRGDYSSPLRMAILSRHSQGGVLIGLHGYVHYNFDSDETVRALIEAGAKPGIDKDGESVVRAALSYIEDPEIFRLVWGQVNPQNYNPSFVLYDLARDYRKKWGSERLEIFKMVLNQFSDEGLRKERISRGFLGFALQNLDTKALDHLVASGFDFASNRDELEADHLERITSTQKRIDGYTTYLNTLDLQKDLVSLKANLEWLKAQGR